MLISCRLVAYTKMSAQYTGQPSEELLTVPRCRRPLRFFWTEREDGQKPLFACYTDGNADAVTGRASFKAGRLVLLLAGVPVFVDAPSCHIESANSPGQLSPPKPKSCSKNRKPSATSSSKPRHRLSALAVAGLLRPVIQKDERNQQEGRLAKGPTT